MVNISNGSESWLGAMQVVSFYQLCSFRYRQERQAQWSMSINISRQIPMKMRVKRVLKVESFLRFCRKSSFEISSLSILMLALQQVLQISHIGVAIVSTTILSSHTILVSIHSIIHPQCTYAIDPEHSHNFIKISPSSRQMRHLGISSQGFRRVQVVEMEVWEDMVWGLGGNDNYLYRD